MNRNCRSMRKRANGAIRWVHALFAAGGGALKDSAYLLAAASGAAGVVTGWTLSKATSKGVGEPDVAKKLYETQRLDSDIDYLRTRMADEDRARKAQQAGAKDAGLFRI